MKTETAAPSRPDLSFLGEYQLPPRLRALGGGVGKGMESHLSRLLGATLAAGPRVVGFYDRWLSGSRSLLAEAGGGAGGAEGGPAPSVAEAWRLWDEAKGEWLRDGSKRALCILVERCLRALPDILAGKTKAAEVIFPDSSLELVEDVYKSDEASLAFNECLSEVLAAAVGASLEAEPAARIRILEIGAGTGATTVEIIGKLRPYRERIAEYCYTDLSKAFLFHAEKAYLPSAPYLRTRLFNVESPIAEQGIEGGGYDFVVAANVLHATKNIRNTLRNAKAVLRRNGALLMNEMSERSLYGHLTFGLLDGWWLNEDDQIRIPGAPGLYPETWKEILESEGFHSVLFPAREAHRLGQTIVVAASDGMVRQKAAAKAGKAPGKSRPGAPKSADAPREAASEARPAGDRDEALLERTVGYLKQVIGKVLKISSHKVDASEPLETYGVDSILIGMINDQLKRSFDDVGSTLLFEYQTVDALARHFLETRRANLLKLFGLEAGAPPAAAPRPADLPEGPARPGLALPGRQSRRFRAGVPPASDGRPAVSGGPIAIVGISGIYPQAANLEAYWEKLKSGGNCVREVPGNRWPLEGFYEPDVQRAIEMGKSYCKWGGFIDEFSEFDALFFGISPRDAMNMDPQERLFLQASWRALEDSGYTRSALRRKFKQRVGVFAGVTRPGFNLFGSTKAIREEGFYPRMSFGSVANRLSYFLDINGPSMPIDTMCSSSLTAIHEACENIHRGLCDLAFAGGVNLYLHPSGYVDMSAQRMLSRDGMCKSFGEGGNGFVPGEGVGVVLLRPLESAVRDGDSIHGVILATHINHGGKTNGYTVPNPKAQAELIRHALDKAGINARSVSYIEAHGTGTELGDPIEVSGLQQAFAKDTVETGFCRIGSAKSNIGHLEAAAGIAGVTKVLLQMKHGQIAPTLHAERLNPHIDFRKTPLEVNRSLQPWERPVLDGKVHPRIAGISSFGAGGANAFVLIREYVPPAQEAGPAGPQPGPDFLIPLSARTPEQLKRVAADLLEFLAARDGADGHGAAPAMADLAYTLQVGREAMEERLGFIVRSAGELAAKLKGYLAGETPGDAVYEGSVKRKNEGMSIISQDEDMRETIYKWVARNKLPKLLDLWVKGFELDWERLHQDPVPRRINLPTYPFAKERYWVDSLGLAPGPEPVREAAGNFDSIEELFDKIDGDAIDTDQAIRMLKTWA